MLIFAAFLTIRSSVGLIRDVTIQKYISGIRISKYSTNIAIKIESGRIGSTKIIKTNTLKPTATQEIIYNQ